MPKETFFNLPAAKRQKILDVAIEEFAQNDYDSASISRMVANAGIAKGSFYQYFEGKMDLYRYLFDLMAERKQELLNTAPPDPQMGIFDQMRWLAQTGVAFELTYPQLSKIGYRAAASRSLPDSFTAQAKASASQYFKQLLAQGQAQGDVAPDIDVDLAAFIFNVVFMELGQYMFQRLQVDAEEAAQEFFNSEAAQALLDQALQILESGVGPH